MDVHGDKGIHTVVDPLFSFFVILMILSLPQNESEV